MELAPSVIQKYREQTDRCSIEFLFAALNATTLCESTYKASGNQRLHIEFSLVKLCRITATPAPIEQSPVVTTAQVTTPPIKVEQPIKEVPKIEIPEKKIPKKEITEEVSVPDYPVTRSIKGLIKKVDEESAKSSGKQRPKESGEDLFDLEKLEVAWQEMADSEKNLQRLANAISDTKPVISENANSIVFNVSNELQKDWIVKNCKLRLESFLKERLNNKNIELIVEVPQVEEGKDKKLYMPEEKAKFLLENNQELREFQKDLKLEIK